MSLVAECAEAAQAKAPVDRCSEHAATREQASQAPLLLKEELQVPAESLLAQG